MSLLNKFRKNENKKNYKEEILEHICDLLNTKQSFGALHKDFGLDSYVYMGSNKQITKRIILDIKNNLEKFEKRIQVIDVEAVASHNRFLLSFLIKCKIENTTHSFHLSFHHQKNLFNMEQKL